MRELFVQMISVGDLVRSPVYASQCSVCILCLHVCVCVCEYEYACACVVCMCVYEYKNVYKEKIQSVIDSN